MGDSVVGGIFAIIGLIVGFLLQWAKETRNDKSNRKKLRSQIDSEMNDLSHVLQISIEAIESSLSYFKTNGRFRFVGEHQSIANEQLFDKIFPLIVLDVDQFERRNISEFYNQVNLYREQQARYEDFINPTHPLGLCHEMFSLHNLNHLLGLYDASTHALEALKFVYGKREQFYVVSKKFEENETLIHDLFDPLMSQKGKQTSPLDYC